MVDAYEQIHGPVDDRSIFDGEIVVPPHLRNLSLINSRHSGLFGSLSRSRTFLPISNNSRHTFHSSVPDLSHNTSNGTQVNNHNSIQINSINNSTPSLIGNGQNGDQSNASEKDNFDETVMPYANQSLRSLNEIELRRKSEDQSILFISQSRQLVNSTKTIKPIVYTTKPSDFKRNDRYKSMEPNSDNYSYMTLIQTNIHSRSNSYLNRSFNRSPMRTISPLCATSSLHNINMTDSSSSETILSTASPPVMLPLLTTTTGTFHSNKKHFAGELSLNNLTKFTIPRVSLSHLPIVINASSSPSSTASTPTDTLTSTFKQFN